MKSSLRYSLLLVLLLVSVWTTWDMWQRSQLELLWGYRTMVLFLASFLFLVLLLQPIWLKKGQAWRWLGLSGMSILLLSAGFPDILIPLPFLMMVGFIPLLQIEQEIADSAGIRKGATVWKYAFLTFLGWNIITTFWVANSSIGAGMFAMIANSLLMTIPFTLFHYTKRRLPRLGYASFVVYWISWEYFHLNWDLTWPWLTLGNSFAEWPSLAQWYTYTGVFGGTLWILVANVIGLKLLHQFLAKERMTGSIIRLTALVLLPVFFSLFLYTTYEEKGRPVEVLAVQPNFEPHYVKFTLPNPAQVGQMIRLTDSLLTDQTRYVILPEAAIWRYDIDKGHNHPAINRLEKHYQNRQGLNVLFGASAFQTFPPDYSSRNSRTITYQDRPPFVYEASNIAGQLTIGQSDIPVYRKSKLVPGPEIFPFQAILWPFKPIVEQVGGTTAGNVIQEKRTAFPSSAGKIGTLICYESIFGEFVTGYVREGAEALFVMTNDGWWDDTPGQRQHLYFASLRAIETRRPVARSANTGTSAFINQRGDLEQTLDYNLAGAIRQDMMFNSEPTFYVRWGNIIARVASFLSALLLLNLMVKTIQGKNPLA